MPTVLVMKDLENRVLWAWSEAMKNIPLNLSRPTPTLIYPLDMDKSPNAIIGANYWRAQIEEKDTWQIQTKISL